MSRSGDLRSKHDALIREFLTDPLYDVREDGTVWTRRAPFPQTSLILDTWREAGRIDTSGYVQISYKGRRLLAHRIVYQKFNGSLQSDLVVDHEDKNRQNNKPDNLKLVTARTNRLYMERRKEEQYANV